MAVGLYFRAISLEAPGCVSQGGAGSSHFPKSGDSQMRKLPQSTCCSVTVTMTTEQHSQLHQAGLDLRGVYVGGLVLLRKLMFCLVFPVTLQKK